MSSCSSPVKAELVFSKYVYESSYGCAGYAGFTSSIDEKEEDTSIEVDITPFLDQLPKSPGRVLIINSPRDILEATAKRGCHLIDNAGRWYGADEVDSYDKIECHDLVNTAWMTKPFWVSNDDVDATYDKRLLKTKVATTLALKDTQVMVILNHIPNPHQTDPCWENRLHMSFSQKAEVSLRWLARYWPQIATSHTKKITFWAYTQKEMQLKQVDPPWVTPIDYPGFNGKVWQEYHEKNQPTASDIVPKCSSRVQVKNCIEAQKIIDL